MENLLSHAGIFFTMAAVLTFEAILLRLASEPEGGREVKARKGESHLGAFIRENWYWLLLLFCALLRNTEILHDMNQQDTFIAFWWLTVCLWASPLSCKQYMNTRIL